MARILVADDEEGIRTFLAQALEREGHEITQAEDGAAAVALLDRQAFDLVLTDLKMPKVDGMELLRKLQQEQPETEVIMLTAFGTVDSAVEAMRLGAFDYLQKPIGSPGELRLIVARALEHRELVKAKVRAQREGDDAPTLTFGDPTMEPVVSALRKVAPTMATVLLLGESGTGKEVTARAAHLWSQRASGPFVAVNCAALTDTLLESELFGHEKGAFTGAHSSRQGRIELAQGGTFFLDEIGELRADLQAKLLRVLQERRFERLGGTRTFSADVRWIAATNRDLRGMIAAGSFREDLYHRLAVFPIRLPALRERKQDIPFLAKQLLVQIAHDLRRKKLELSEDALAAIAQADWPGNVRELRNTLERAAILAEGDTLTREHIAFDPTHQNSPAITLPQVTLENIERLAIEQTLTATSGNRKQAAERLGIGLRTLYEKLKRYGL